MVAQLTACGVDSPEAEARWLCEEASGFAGAEWLTIASSAPTARAHAQLERMLARRLAGEPLQYALGCWSFRGLDLMVDRRVLIPRPETEWVVEMALREAERLGIARGSRAQLGTDAPAHLVADLGTGSGAIAIALARELRDTEVWATDVSADALAVARANVAGCAASGVQLAAGDWYAALPGTVQGRLRLIVANPPYIATTERDELPTEVIAHEPEQALISGPSGLEAYRVIVPGAPTWLARPGALVLEIAPHQADALIEMATASGFAAVEVLDDLAGRPRVLVARL